MAALFATVARLAFGRVCIALIVMPLGDVVSDVSVMMPHACLLVVVSVYTPAI